MFTHAINPTIFCLFFVNYLSTFFEMYFLLAKTPKCLHHRIDTFFQLNGIFQTKIMFWRFDSLIVKQFSFNQFLQFFFQ